MAHPPPERAELLELYKLHIEEVRFQTKFNWERTQYFLVLNIGILGVAATTLKQDLGISSLLLLAVVFFVGAFICRMSIAVVRQGHKYYCRSVLQRTRVELLLQLHGVESSAFNVEPFSLTVNSTKGQAVAEAMLAHPEEYLSRPMLQRGQINWYIQTFLYLIATVDVAGLIIVLYMALPRLVWR